MKRFNLPIVALAAAVVGAVGVLYGITGCGKSSGGDARGDTLAVINGDSISMDEFHKYLENKSSVRVMTNNGAAVANVADSLAFQALQDMVARQVTLQLARDEGTYPSEGDITKELDFRRKLDPDFLNKLKAAGMTISDVKESLLLSLARERLLTKNVTLTMAEAEDYIKNNPKQFMEPATADLLWVFVKSPANRQKVDAALQSGQTFSVVASQYTEIPGAREQGGRFPTRNISQMNPDLQKKVNAGKEGQATDWLALSDGFAKFFIEKKTAERPSELNSYRKEAIRRELAQRRGAQAIDLEKRVLDKLVKSKIDVKVATLADPWKKAMDRYKEQQKVDAPTGGTPTGAAPPPNTK